MVKKVFLLTKRFPYDPPMEAPLAEELEYWAKEYPGRLFLVPKRQKKQGEWEIPKNIKTIVLPKEWKQPGKMIRIAETLFSPLFLKECIYLLLGRKTINPGLYKAAFTATYEAFIYKRRLAVLIDQQEGSVLIYSYWFNQIAYSAALLKKKRPNLKVVARAVSRDLYEFRSPRRYLPIKRQFKGKLDCIYTISQEGLKYLKENYQFPDRDLAISRKGIHVGSEITSPSGTNQLVLLSIAVFKPLKRIDKIIKAIALFAECNPEVEIFWHHLGGAIIDRMSKEEKKLHELAKNSFSKKNVDYNFHGTLPHSEILKFLKSRDIDVLINASETEGVPLSIMEAMAHGVPAIAPHVGGISELITPQHGILMSENPDIREISHALSQYEFYKSSEVREKAKQFISKNFNVAKNYPKLIKELTEI